jgi:hypothetical protein
MRRASDRVQKFDKAGSLMKYGSSFSMVPVVLALAACGQAPPTAAADDRRIDQAMVKVKAEQDRTDQPEAQKQRTAVELLSRQSSNRAPILEAPIRPVLPAVPEQHASKGANSHAAQR